MDNSNVSLLTTPTARTNVPISGVLLHYEVATKNQNSIVNINFMANQLFYCTNTALLQN